MNRKTKEEGPTCFPRNQKYLSMACFKVSTRSFLVKALKWSSTPWNSKQKIKANSRGLLISHGFPLDSLQDSECLPCSQLEQGLELLVDTECRWIWLQSCQYVLTSSQKATRKADTHCYCGKESLNALNELRQLRFALLSNWRSPLALANEGSQLPPLL